MGLAAGESASSAALTAANYDHAMAFPRTVDAPWGADDADEAAPATPAEKTPYALDGQAALLNHDVPASTQAKVRRAVAPCGVDTLTRAWRCRRASNVVRPSPSCCRRARVTTARTAADRSVPRAATASTRCPPRSCATATMPCSPFAKRARRTLKVCGPAAAPSSLCVCLCLCMCIYVRPCTDTMRCAANRAVPAIEMRYFSKEAMLAIGAAGGGPKK
jgi:hypothetical protein